MRDARGASVLPSPAIFAETVAFLSIAGMQPPPQPQSTFVFQHSKANLHLYFGMLKPIVELHGTTSVSAECTKSLYENPSFNRVTVTADRISAVPNAGQAFTRGSVNDGPAASGLAKACQFCVRCITEQIQQLCQMVGVRFSYKAGRYEPAS